MILVHWGNNDINMFCLFSYRNCGLILPTWSELRHFVYFLNHQLEKSEKSPYCSLEMAPDLPDFRPFVIDFMFRMARVGNPCIILQFAYKLVTICCNCRIGFFAVTAIFFSYSYFNKICEKLHTWFCIQNSS